MKTIYAGAALVALLFSACGDKHDEKVQKPTVMPQKTEQPAAAEAVPAANEELYGVSAQEASKPQEPVQPQPTGGKQGVVLETMDAAGYTYAKIDDGNGEYWIAGPKTAIKVGEKVSFAPQMWMENFPSKTLNRTFDKILFVAVIAPLKEGAAHTCESCDSHGAPSSAPAEQKPQESSSASQPVAKAEGGYTIAEIFAQSAKLKDKTVKVNGKVTKVVRGVMGKDWVHIQDGSRAGEQDDLVVTSPSADVKEGETVTVTGVVKTDVDFGYGYFYPVLIEEATFTRL
ncbi:GW dipeptide domain-containing protein [Hydrogenimonas sp.]